MASPAFLFPHVLYSNCIPLADAVHLVGSQLLQTINNDVPVKFGGFVMSDQDVKNKRWMDGFEGFSRDLKAYPEVRSQRFMDEVVAYDAEMKVKRWLEDLKAYGMVPDLESCLIEQENQKAFNELMAFDAIVTNKLKNIVTMPNEELKKIALRQVIKEDFKLKRIDKEEKEEDGIEEFEAYEDYCAMKLMRRQGAKRHHRLLSRKHKY